MWLTHHLCAVVVVDVCVSVVCHMSVAHRRGRAMSQCPFTLLCVIATGVNHACIDLDGVWSHVSHALMDMMCKMICLQHHTTHCVFCLALVTCAHTPTDAHTHTHTLCTHTQWWQRRVVVHTAPLSGFTRVFLGPGRTHDPPCTVHALRVLSRVCEPRPCHGEHR